MIVVHLDRLLLERRMSLTELAEQVDLTLANLSILKTGKARAIRFSTLDAICTALHCQPGDLLVFDRGRSEDDEGDGARRSAVSDARPDDRARKDAKSKDQPHNEGRGLLSRITRKKP